MRGEGRAEWVIIIGGWMLRFLQQVSGRWQKHAFESTVQFHIRQVFISFSVWAVTTAKTRWSHHHLSHPTTKPWQAGFCHLEYHVVLKHLQVTANTDQEQRLGADVGVFICTLWMRGWLWFTGTFFHAVCTFTFPLRTRNKTRLFQFSVVEERLSEQWHISLPWHLLCQQQFACYFCGDISGMKLDKNADTCIYEEKCWFIFAFFPSICWLKLAGEENLRRANLTESRKLIWICCSLHRWGLNKPWDCTPASEPRGQPKLCLNFGHKCSFTVLLCASCIASYLTNAKPCNHDTHTHAHAHTHKGMFAFSFHPPMQGGRVPVLLTVRLNCLRAFWPV